MTDDQKASNAEVDRDQAAMDAMLLGKITVLNLAAQQLTRPVQSAESTTLLAAQYADLYAKRVAAEKVVDGIKEEMTRLEVVLLEQYVQEGVQSIKTIGGNVYLHHQVWASAEDAGLLAVSDWAWMVKDSVNSQTLSSAVRELEIDAEGEPIFPEGVPEAAVKITHKYNIRVRK